MTEPSAEQKNRTWRVRARTGAAAALKSTRKQPTRIFHAAIGTAAALRGKLKHPARGFRAATGAGAALKGALKGSLKDRSWKVRAGIGLAAAFVIVGVGAALLALTGRPVVSVSSGEALVQVHLGGVGAQVTSIHATSAGQPLRLAHQGTNFRPVTALPQGGTVHV